MYQGISLNLGIPITPSVVYRYKGASEMNFDPVTETGTYASGDEIGTVEYKGGGGSGVWLGAAFAPFSEAYAKQHQATYRLDIAMRTPNKKKTLWSADDKGRGAAPGGFGFRLAGAFSSDHGAVEPWMEFEYVREGKVSVDVIDDEGILQVSGLEVRPSSALSIRGGIELIALDDPEREIRVSFGFHMGAGYHTWSDVPSGLYLPDVLDQSRSVAVTSSDYISLLGGFNLESDITRWVGLKLGAEGRFYSPRYLEHVYPVFTTVDTFGLFFAVDLIGKIRQPDAVSVAEPAPDLGPEPDF